MNSLIAFHVKFPAIKSQNSPTPTKLEQSFLKTPRSSGSEREDSCSDLIAG